MSFKNKVVWIVGASSGIGKALAEELKQQGARLILSSRNRDKLYQIKSSLKQNPIDTHILPLDLENKDTLEDKANEAWRIYRGIDYLFNCAGISQRAEAIETVRNVEEKIFDVNYWGTVLLSKAIAEKMIEQGDGHLVVISSVVGKFGTAQRSSYAASKHALHGYFDSLRSEVFNKGINITIACPGFVKTDITLHALNGDGSLYNKMDEHQANGIAAEECANEILKAVKQKKEEVVIARGQEKYGVLMKRFFPKWFSQTIRKRKVVG